MARYRLVHAGQYLGGRFTVTGGPFATPKIMGWHLTNDAGFTLGVTCDSTLADRLNKLEDLVEKLAHVDLPHDVQEAVKELSS